MLKDVARWCFGVTISLFALYGAGAVLGLLSAIFAAGYNFGRHLM